MDDPPPLPDAPPPRRTGRVVGGIIFMTGWALVHLLLFYLFFVSGVLIDLIVGMLKTIFIHNTHSTNAFSKVFAWADLLLTGLIIVGTAGVPRGLAIFWDSRRKSLKRIFWLMFIAGVALELWALFTLVSNALTV